MTFLPHRVSRYHRLAVRQVCYHAKYPLFASCSDDATTQIFHGMVYNDLMQNALIVPVKVRAAATGNLRAWVSACLHCRLSQTV